MNHPESLLFLANFLRILSHGKISMRAARKLHESGFDSVRKLIHAKDYEVRRIVGGITADRTVELIRELREGYREPFQLMQASGIFNLSGAPTLASLYKSIDAIDRYSFLCANTMTGVPVSTLATLMGKNMASFLTRFPDFMEFLAQNHIVVDTHYLK